METKTMNNDTNDKKSPKEMTKKYLYDTLRLWRGCVTGFVAGYVISYFFQGEFVKAKIGFGGYIMHIFDILVSSLFYNDRSLIQIAIIAWISALIGMSIGCNIEKRLIEKGKIKAWTSKKRN